MYQDVQVGCYCLIGKYLLELIPELPAHVYPLAFSTLSKNAMVRSAQYCFHNIKLLI